MASRSVSPRACGPGVAVAEGDGPRRVTMARSASVRALLGGTPEPGTAGAGAGGSSGRRRGCSVGRFEVEESLLGAPRAR